MNTVTHALIPVIIAGIYERSHRAPENRRGSLSGKDILCIGIFGAAPDLLNPHLSLDDRYTSWSHSIICWAALLAILVVTTLLRTKWSQWLTRSKIVWFSAAYGLHLVCDAISGGIAWLYPWKPSIIGEYLVHPTMWIPLDIFCFLTAYSLFRMIPKLRQLRQLRNTHAKGDLP